MIVPGQTNLKVHFAGSEVMNQFIPIHLMGVNYALYTAFPFIERMLIEKHKSPLMPCFLDPFDIPKYIDSHSRHTIQDSGLFTLMFGSHSGSSSMPSIDDWYSALVDFTNEHTPETVTIVEVDCQKLTNSDKAHELRVKMREQVKNRVINVFHLEDGQYGLDRLIEFTDYIAISVPELRALGKKHYMESLIDYIRNKKPNIDIHLLGCTEVNLLKKFSFCTSSDSTSYIAGKRFGFLKNRHISTINDSIIDIVGRDIYQEVRKYNNERNTRFILLSIYLCLKDYNKYAGSQD